MQIGLPGATPAAPTALAVVDATGAAISDFDFIQVWTVNATNGGRILAEREDTSVGGNLIELVLNRVAGQLQISNTFSSAALGTARTDLTAAVYGFSPPDSDGDGMADATSRPDLIYAGFSDGGLFFREVFDPANPSQITELTNYGGSRIRDIFVDPFDFRKVIIADSKGRIWSNNNAPSMASPFREITANIKTISGGDVRAVQYVNITPNPGDEALLVGGLGGVFHYGGDPFSGTFAWREFGNNLPNVLVTDLEYNHTDDILIAGTWGRGAWSIKNLKTQAVAFPQAGSLTEGLLPATGPQPGADSAALTQSTATGFVLELRGTPQNDQVVLRRDPFNPLLLEVSVDGQVLDLGGAVEITSVAQVVFDGLAGNDRLLIDVGNGVVGFPGTSLADGGQSVIFLGGSGIDTLELTGGPVMTSASNYSAATKAGTILLASDDAIGEYHVEDVESVEQNGLAAPIDNRLRTLGAGLAAR